MKSILCFELKRCFGSKRLYLSLLTGIVISLLHIIFGVLPLTQWLSSWQGDFFLTPHSAYGHWIGMDSSTVWPTLLYMLLPFLCAFPFSDTVSWDFNTGYVMQIFVRRKKSTYLFAKALTIFIANAKPKGKRQVKASQGNTSYGKMVKQDKPFVKKQNTHTEQKPTAK